MTWFRRWLGMVTTTEACLEAAHRRGPMAVVGNAPLARNCSTEIDRFPTVIRFNNYRLNADTGRRTTWRCVSGWYDIEIRAQRIPECSPFTRPAVESTNLAMYEQLARHRVLTATWDIHALVPVPNPSTGLALLVLCEWLELPVTAYGFNGFRDQTTTHQGAMELATIRKMAHVILV